MACLHTVVALKMVMVTLYGRLTYLIPSTESIESHAMGISVHFSAS